MIGIFLKNEAGRLCFVRPPQEEQRNIKAVRYIAESHLAVIIFSDDDENMLTTEIAAELREAFQKEAAILIVHSNDGVSAEKEYNAEILTL